MNSGEWHTAAPALVQVPARYSVPRAAPREPPPCRYCCRPSGQVHGLWSPRLALSSIPSRSAMPEAWRLEPTRVLSWELSTFTKKTVVALQI
ncbi:uncharacterized protein UV8b_04835 [Ustilaginoidea virens]|uniref:Uncharacterized protein n=1 Tax=Ustilaginoidea virens TaxID=1159556 RepID=A0A8E5HSW3_USTVR|nr:uncharacterized protein UV8b_04835 [Ustilaginoidea virens]QUC20594.1 hypothetical protein UV8b_04835 [Ustilaginoidea virens]